METKRKHTGSCAKEMLGHNIALTYHSTHTYATYSYAKENSLSGFAIVS